LAEGARGKAILESLAPENLPEPPAQL
jgi:hypothetical protein